MICMICHDSCQELLKICNCNESLVCKDCIKKLNDDKTNFCPICRTPLRIELSFNSKTFLKNIFYYFSTLSIILLIQLYPFIDFVNKTQTVNNTSILYNKSFQYFTIFTTTFVVQPLTFLYIINFLKDRNITRIMSKDGALYITVITLSCFIYDVVIIAADIDYNFFVYYIAAVGFPFFLLPFLIMILKLLTEYFSNLKELLILYSTDNIIKVRETISV